MDGIACPLCGRYAYWLVTMSEWRYHCHHCDIRFNRQGQWLGPKTRRWWWSEQMVLRRFADEVGRCGVPDVSLALRIGENWLRPERFKA